METTVRFENVSKKYRLGLTRTSLPTLIADWLKKPFGRAEEQKDQTFWALREVDFTLRQGESLALLGPNGAGKTTILKLLAKITTPTGGQIQINGRLSALIELGAGFHPDLTGRENIYLNGTILGLTRKQIDQRFDEIADFSELEHFIDTPVKRYSSGMAVRLGFAVASCIEPDILLVDEVLAVGDSSFQQKCMQRIHTLVENGTSIIFVSHNLYLVQAVCSRALYIDHGQIKFDGATADAIEAYEHALHEERARKFSQGSAANQLTDVALDAPVEITKVEVWDLDGPPRAELQSKQPAQIRIHYNAYEPVGAVHASVFIIRSDGLTCCMMRTKLDDFALNIERGQGMITLHLDPLQLIGGTYFAEAWFLNQSDSMSLSRKSGRSEWFNVKGLARSYEESSGVYEPISQWEHEQHITNPVSANGHGASSTQVLQLR